MLAKYSSGKVCNKVYVAGEDLGAAAVREVKEETGVDAEFVSLVSFRHVHGVTFHCSDIYFIVHLRPISQTITMCPKELQACEWMKVCKRCFSV